jgi:hypothetical protein
MPPELDDRMPLASETGQAAGAVTLARCTPVSLNLSLPTPSVDWADLGTVRFSEPFFHQTINRWASGDPQPRLVRTTLEALADFDNALGHDPCGLIFHMSRCGSTLVSRLLGTIPQTLTISEPQPLNALLSGAVPGADETALAQAVRCMVRALGGRRFGEQSYVLKLSSWNIRHLRLFRRAFPAAKIVFVQREPAEVLASMHADPPAWLQLRQNPAFAEALFGIQADAVARFDADEFGAHALAAIIAAAFEAAERGALIVDYSELAPAAWTRVAPFFAIHITAPDITRMREEARFYSKDPNKRVFIGDPPERCVDRRLRDLAAGIVGPACSELNRCRHVQLSEDRTTAAILMKSPAMPHKPRR